MFLLLDHVRNHVESKNNEPLDTSLSKLDLYQSFFKKNIERNLLTVLRWPVDDQIEFLRRLAYDWFVEGRQEALVKDFRQRLQDWHGERDPQEVEEYAAKVWNCSFFTRVDDKFRFLHRSFVEYFVADGAVSDLQQGKLDRWDYPFYTEIFDFAFDLLQETKDIRSLVKTMFAEDRPIAQGNLLASIYRHRLPELESLFEEQVNSSKYAIVQQVAAQGWGAYPPTRDSIERMVLSCSSVPNSITRMTLRGICRRWIRKLGNCDDLLDDLPAAAFSKKDAIAILRPDLSDGLLRTYRRALDQDDDRWTSIIGAMYLLGAVADTESDRVMKRIAERTDLPEIREAYEDTCRGFCDMSGAEESSVEADVPVGPDDDQEPRVYVSYAWAAERGKGAEHPGFVARLCKEVERAGLNVSRDEGTIELGDRISDYMRELGTGDRVFVLLSNAYLKSANCMYELSLLWSSSHDDNEKFRARVHVFTTTNIGTINERLECAKHWKNEYELTRSKIEEVGIDRLGPTDLKRWKQMGAFANDVNETLAQIQDVLRAGDFDEYLKYIIDLLRDERSPA